MRKIKIIPFLLVLALLTAALIAILRPESIEIMGKSFLSYFLSMMKFLPLTFLLIGLFEVWVKPERIEKHLGHGGGVLSFLWAILLGSVTIGPMLVSLPIAASLYRKGARFSVIFTYLGAASVCRIPMTLFEASCIGLKFTLIRYSVSIPLIILSSILIGKILQQSDYVITDKEK